jgi:hypothetical protein
MRLVTFQPAGGTPHVGVVVGDQVFPLDSSVYPDMTSFLSAGSEALAEAEKIDRGETQTHTKHHLTDVTLLPPVTRPGKIIAVGPELSRPRHRNQAGYPDSADHFCQVSLEYQRARRSRGASEGRSTGRL